MTPPHTICATKNRVEFGDSVLLTDCRSACAADVKCQTIQWQATRSNGFNTSEPGQCFLVHDDCSSTKTYDDGLWKDFCMQIESCHRAETPNEFDSHICFAAASPVRDPESGSFERVYYMGADRAWFELRMLSLAFHMVAGCCKPVHRRLLCLICACRRQRPALRRTEFKLCAGDCSC